jgi:hypothetical protein
MDIVNTKTLIELGAVGILVMVILMRDSKNYKDMIRREDRFIEVIEKNTKAIDGMTSEFQEKRREIAEQDVRFNEFFKKFDHFITILNDKLLDVIRNMAHITRA